MFYFKKNNKINLDFYLDKIYLEKNLVPRISKNCIPKWWKNLPNSYEDTDFKQIKWSTVKRCIGAIETFMNGIMIPLVEDLSLSDSSEFLDHWILDNQHGIEFLIIQSTWTLGDFNRDITVIPKIINAKGKNNLDVEIQKHPYSMNNITVVPKGTTFLHVIPLTKKEFDLNIKSIN